MHQDNDTLTHIGKYICLLQYLGNIRKKLLIMARKSVEMTIPTQTMIIRTMFKCSLVLWFHISLCVSIFADNQTMRYSLVFEFEVVVLTNTLYCCFLSFVVH